MGTTLLQDQIPKLMVAAVVFLLPLRAVSLPGLSGLTPGMILAILLLLPILNGAGAYWISWPTFLFAASLISAPFLMYLADIDLRVDMSAAGGTIVILCGAMLTFFTLLWSRSELGLRATSLLYSGGWILQQSISPSSWSSNAWKYAFVWPVAIFVAALIYRNRSRFLSVTVASGFAVLAILNDYRSNFGIWVIVALLVAWRWHRRAPKSTIKVAGILLALSGACWGIYRLGVWLALEGHLGARNQLVTLQQAATGQSLISAGRTESSAAFSLFAHRPMGYGPGVVPNFEDVSVAKTALQSTGANLDGTHVNEYIVGHQIKLHSVASDLWVGFGIAGLLLAIYFAWLLISRLITQPRVTVLFVFASLVALWGLAFSPIMANIHEVIFASALATPLARDRRRAGPKGQPDNNVCIQCRKPHGARLGTTSGLCGSKQSCINSMA